METRTNVLPLMERPVVAAALAGSSGALDAWSLTQLQSFSTVQSGNVVSIGYDLISGNWSHLHVLLFAVASFAAGSFVCAIAVAALTRTARPYTRIVLLFEALVLLVAALASSQHLLAAFAVGCVCSFVAGVQGNAFHRLDGMLYGNIAVTFPLQAAASLLGRAAMRHVHDDGDPHLRQAGAYGVVLAGFAAGGGLGYLTGLLWAPAPLLVSAAIVTMLACIARSDDTAAAAPTP